MSGILLHSSCLLLSISFVAAYKILMLAPGIPSHQMFYSHLGKELIKHGYEVVLPVGDKEMVIKEVEVRDSLLWVS